MPRYIAKFTDKKSKKDFYLEWSTVVDAPVTYGVSLEEFKKYYESAYGRKSMDELSDRLMRVEQKGTSSQIDDSVEELISCNRAGDGETELTYDQIVETYCLQVNAK